LPIGAASIRLTVGSVFAFRLTYERNAMMFLLMIGLFMTGLLMMVMVHD